MTAPNHITGGIVFTGLFCSFLYKYICKSCIYFSNYFSSLLPDIDHTKSWIGKSVYPIAKWISRNYGHRTITHSIFFLIGYIFDKYLLKRILEKIIVFQLSYFFSVLSHFILIWLL
jgi:inner membrane protein